MKTYKTWEVIKMLTENPNLEFETKDKYKLSMNGTLLRVHHYRKETDINENLRLADHEYAKADEWALVAQLVTFDEARKSGKKFKYETWDGFLYLSGVLHRLKEDYLNVGINQLLDSKEWIIEE